MNFVTSHFSILLRLWVIGIAVLVVIAPTDISLQVRMLGLMFLGMLYWSLWSVRGTVKNIPVPVKTKPSFMFLAILFFAQLMAANYASISYTGSSLLSSLINVIDGVDAYGQYQSHFAEQGFRNEAFYYRLPAVFSLALTKIIYLYLLSLFVSSYYSLRAVWFLSIFSALPIVLFSLSRGTFFEIFEVALATVYFIFASKYNELGLRKNRLKWLLIGMVGIGILSFLFLVNTGRRFGSFDDLLGRGCFTNFCFIPYNFIPYFEYLLYSLAVYFSTGIYMFGEYFAALLRGEMTYSIIPFFYSFSGQLWDGLPSDLCSRYFSCAGVWTPDILKFFSVFGFTVFLLMPLLIRIVLRLESRILATGSVFALPFLYTILVLLISLPVGKFFTGSSANVIASLFFLSLLVAQMRARIVIS